MEVVRDEHKQRSRWEEYITSFVSSPFSKMDFAKITELNKARPKISDEGLQVIL